MHFISQAPAAPRCARERGSPHPRASFKPIPPWQCQPATFVIYRRQDENCNSASEPVSLTLCCGASLPGESVTSDGDNESPTVFPVTVRALSGRHVSPGPIICTAWRSSSPFVSCCPPPHLLLIRGADHGALGSTDQHRCQHCE